MGRRALYRAGRVYFLRALSSPLIYQQCPETTTGSGEMGGISAGGTATHTRKGPGRGLLSPNRPSGFSPRARSGQNRSKSALDRPCRAALVGLVTGRRARFQLFRVDDGRALVCFLLHSPPPNFLELVAILKRLSHPGQPPQGPAQLFIRHKFSLFKRIFGRRRNRLRSGAAGSRVPPPWHSPSPAGRAPADLPSVFPPPPGRIR